MVDKSRLHLYLRCAQFVLPFVVLALIGYCKGKPGYWEDVTTPLAMSVVASIATFLLTLFYILPMTRKSASKFMSSKLVAVVPDVIVIILWIGTIVTILQSRKYPRVPNPPRTQKDAENLLKQHLVEFQPPKEAMRAGGAFAILETLVSIAAAVLCFTSEY